MKRAKRLEPVSEMAEEAERECAQRVAAVNKRLADAEKRCTDLKRYVEEYRVMFQQRAKVGMSVAGLRDYQIFIARLNEAVKQQDNVVAQVRNDCERERKRWIDAAARKRAVDKVIDKARAEDQRSEDRALQKDTDERAQRISGAR